MKKDYINEVIVKDGYRYEFLWGAGERDSADNIQLEQLRAGCKAIVVERDGAWCVFRTGPFITHLDAKQLDCRKPLYDNKWGFRFGCHRLAA